MLISINDIKLNIEFDLDDFSSLIPAIFIHGFTGSAKDWNFVIKRLPQGFNPIFIDIIGHGKSDSSEDLIFYSFEKLNLYLHKIYDYFKLKTAIIIGYSMGGRIALNFAINNSKLISGLLLESTTAGILSESEKNERIKKDVELASYIETNPIENFVDYWMNLPMFGSQKKLPWEIIEKLKSSKLDNNPVGLANSLRGFGTGVMPDLWTDLERIKCKTLLITGEYDKKFTEINSRMKKIINNSKHIIVNDCGHNVHLEKQEVFLNLLSNFLSEFQQNTNHN